MLSAHCNTYNLSLTGRFSTHSQTQALVNNIFEMEKNKQRIAFDDDKLKLSTILHIILSFKTNIHRGHGWIE